jgi:hypothetical protein
MNRTPLYPRVRRSTEGKRLHGRIIAAALALVLVLPMYDTLAAETPKRGGTLIFVVASYPPSFDGHPGESLFPHRFRR